MANEADKILKKISLPTPWEQEIVKLRLAERVAPEWILRELEGRRQRGKEEQELRKEDILVNELVTSISESDSLIHLSDVEYWGAVQRVRLGEIVTNVIGEIDEIAKTRKKTAADAALASTAGPTGESPSILTKSKKMG